MKHGLHHENANATSLGVVRAAVFTLWLGLFLNGWPGLLVPPSELFVVRGLWRLLPAAVLEWIISPAWAAAFPWVFVPVVLAAALGLRPYRLWGGLAFGCILLFEGWVMGLASSVYHLHTLALVMAGVLAFAPAADGFTLGRREPQNRAPAAYRFPLLVMLAAGLLCYAMIGVHRIIHGDVRIYTNPDVMRAWLLIRASEPASTDFTFGLTVANNPWLLAMARLGFFVSTVLEVAAFACLRWRLFAWGWVIFFTAFHGLSLFMLNLFFWENTVLFWLLLLPLGAWLPRRRAERSLTVPAISP